MPRVIIAKIEQLENKWIYLSKVMDALKNVLKQIAIIVWNFYEWNLKGNLRNPIEGI